MLDLDGTMYRGKDPIPEAVTFVKSLQSLKIPFVFVTNNSTASPEEVTERLQNMGIPCEAGNVLTSSVAAAAFMSASPVKQSAYVIGESGLKEALLSHGIKEEEDTPGFVAVGLDRQVTYEKLAKASQAVQAGAVFISTNGDAVIPTENGFLPGNGAITSVITIASGKQPMLIGKPEKVMIDQAVQLLGIPRKKIVLVGDNYDTDILAGIRAGIDTIHVDTGVTAADELLQKNIPPTYSIPSLAHWQLL
nr:TIGR01457 family HAD-type hydrolase [Bacillus piscicola]